MQGSDSRDVHHGAGGAGQVVSGEAVDVSLDIDGLDVEAIVWAWAAGQLELFRTNTRTYLALKLFKVSDGINQRNNNFLCDLVLDM